jgi:ABC-2 type transport system ATP-binding protein
LGLVPQEIALYDVLTPRSNLRFFARLYGLRGDVRERRIGTLLEEIGLADRADQPVRTFSGGMQRRVNIAASLVHDPDIIFLDEPTVGLDPVSRSAIWKILEDLKARGKTVILTTHYMEEAEALSDRVAIIDHGKVVVLGTAAELIRATGIQTVVHVVVAGDAEACLGPIKSLPGVKEAWAGDDRLRVSTDSGSRLLPPLLQTLVGAGVEVRSVEVSTPNLGAVFLHYTGRELRD